MTRIFISHSYLDEAIAYKLVNFLMAALRIEEEEIFCSSNPDQGLSYSSSSVPDQLKKELKNSEALIVLITSDSLHSAWIPFEAGAFWPTDKLMIPILGPGLSLDDLQGPLRSLLSISIEAQDWKHKVNNAINQLVKRLKIEQKVSKRRDDTLREFFEALLAWQSQRLTTDLSQQEEIERLKAQIQDEERSQIQKLEEIERSHQYQIGEKESEITRLQNTAKSQQENNEQLTKKLEDEERSHIQKLEEIKAVLSQEKEELKQSLQSQISQLEQKLEIERSRFTEQQTNLQAAQEKIAEKESIIAQLQEQIEQLKSDPKTTAKDKVELKSEKGVDYTKLQKLLAAENWKEADEETAQVMLEVASRQEEGWLREEDLDNFPCEDLRTINQLWLHYSDRKFGFSVQKEIYESLEGTRQYNKKVWNSFGDRVGWKKGENWLDYDELTFNLDEALTAHLPFMAYGWAVGFIFGGSLSLGGFSSLVRRLVTCKI